MPFAWNNADDTSKKDEAATLESSVLKLEQEVEELRCQLDGIGYLLAEHGCDCDCDHHSEEHDEDCVPCLGCRIEALLPKPQKAKPKDLSSNAENDRKLGAAVRAALERNRSDAENWEIWEEVSEVIASALRNEATK